MKHLRFLNPLCLLGLVSSILLVGCTFLPVLPSTERIANSKVENPAFYIPPMNFKDYKDRNWILLAESKENSWFYDPYSLSEDGEDIVSFDAYISPRPMPAGLDRFNASINGPYRQKIDCFSNYQWSETFYADKMPAQETFVNPRNPKLEYGWIKIKPKSAMAYIRTRVCGRKFIDNANVNYFLYQEGLMKAYKSKQAEGIVKKLPLTPSEEMIAQYTKVVPIKDSQDDTSSTNLTLPIFYEVINNKLTIVDLKKNIREMRVSSYVLDKEFPKLVDYVFRANCESKTYSFTPLGKPLVNQELSGDHESLANVAFDRVCGDHGVYMKLSTSGGR
jgi:hypothetical protein